MVYKQSFLIFGVFAPIQPEGIMILCFFCDAQFPFIKFGCFGFITRFNELQPKFDCLPISRALS